MVQTRTSSIAARTRRRSKTKKSGTVFAIICGAVLTTGVGWLYLNSGPDLEKARIAYTAPDVQLPSRVVENAYIEVPDEVRRAVLLYFEENPERLRSRLVETEFRGSSEGLEIRILAGLQTMLYRVPLDKDLRDWRDDNLADLDRPRMALLKKSLKLFFEDWDVAIRNQSGIEDFQSYRDRVGLAAAVGALGYHVSAIVGNTQYPCIYENKDGLYFLLPRDTKTFRVAGDRTDDRPSLFPGEFEVVVKKGKSAPPPEGEKPEMAE
jgi:hypothetical protein